MRPQFVSSSRAHRGGASPVAVRVLLATLSAVSIAHGASLPRLAFTPLSGDASNVEACPARSTVVVLPAGAFGSSTSTLGAPPPAPRAGADVYYAVRVAAGAFAAAEPEAAITARVSEFLRRVPLAGDGVAGLVIDLQEPGTLNDRFQFGLVNLALTAKAAKAGLRVAFGLPPGFVNSQGDVVKRLANYADLFVLTDGPAWRAEAAWIATQALNKPLVLKFSGARDAAAYLHATVDSVDGSIEMVWTEPANGASLRSMCGANATLARLITPAHDAIPASGTPFRVAVDGGSSRVLWFATGNASEFAALVELDATAAAQRNIRLSGPAGAFEVEWVDALNGGALRPADPPRPAVQVALTCATTSRYALVLVHRRDEGEGKVYTAVEVKDKADLTVEEIIARWQQYQAAQRQKLLNFIAHCFMNLHFESTNIGSGFDISMNFQQFANREGLIEWAQTEFFVNGVKFNNKREFPLPQLEPEKVMTPPLELKLDEKYQYRLAGTERVNGVLCFVVEMEPKVHNELLYSGKVWIDGTTFRQVRQYLRQRGKESNVVANVETQDFEQINDAAGNSFNVLKSITAQQLLNAAGRDFVLQKTYRFDGYTINGPDFDKALADARKSDSPMFRDTPQGLRSLRKKGEERLVEERNTKRVRSLVMGMMYEGSFDFPIPIAGISIADFNYRNTGAQVSIFFAGPILAANLSKPVGAKFRWGVDLALSGLPGNNRVYAGSAEQKDKTLWNWQEDAGIRGTWQATTSLSLTGSTYLSYEYYRGNQDTNKAYTLPRNGITLMPSAELKYARKGYIFTAQNTRGQRLGWSQFGYTELPERKYPAFNRYNAAFAKTYYMGKFTKAGWDFSYYGGTQLDRFSRYHPSFFSRPRIHGLPNGTDSFDAVAIGSVNYGFNIMDFLKLEGMYSYAQARNTDESRRFRKYDGLEMNFGTAGPFGTYLQGTVSYALHGNIERYNSRWGAYIMIFKPLR